MRTIPFAWLTHGRRSLIFPRPKRLQSTQRIPKRKSTASSAVSANGAQTVICRHALRHLSPNGLLNQSITKRFGAQRISVLRIAASAADCVQRNVPFRRLRFGISTRFGLRTGALYALAVCTAARSLRFSTARIPKSMDSILTRMSSCKPCGLRND